MADTTPQSPSSTELEDQAIDLWVHLTSGKATADQYAAFASWRQRSPAHEQAAAVVEGMWQAIGQTSASVPAEPVNRRPSRRHLPWMALAASLAGLTIAGLSEPAKVLMADHSTATGERRTLVLDDGSQVWLNSASAVSINYSPQRRDIHLVKGEAYFEVIKDPVRPFVVHAASGSVQAVGTRFDVDLQDNGVNVGVSEGVVQVSSGGETVRLEHAQQLRYTQGSQPSAIGSFEEDGGPAWQRGKLIFNRKPLSEVFRVTERYLPGALLITGRLPDTEVSGVFDLSDLPAMLNVLARTQSVRIVQLPWLTIVTGKKPPQKNKSNN